MADRATHLPSAHELRKADPGPALRADGSPADFAPMKSRAQPHARIRGRRAHQPCEMSAPTAPLPVDDRLSMPWRDAAVIRVSGACARIIRVVERRDDGLWLYRAIRGSTGRRFERIVTPDTDDGAYLLEPAQSDIRLDTDALLEAIHRARVSDGGAAGHGHDLLLHWLAHEIACDPARRSTRAGEIALLQVVRASSVLHPELGALAAQHIEQFVYEWVPGSPICA